VGFPRAGERIAAVPRSRSEAARRARGRLRRYCAADGLNRLGTLTYAPPFCTDAGQVRADFGVFFRNLRAGLGGEALPYVWVPELHKDGQRFHAHFAVGRYVKQALIAEAWGHRFVSIKRLGDMPVGSGSLGEARRAAGYLSKYVGKSFADASVPRRHRYDVAQGFTPARMQVWGRSADDVFAQASDLLGRRAPERFWLSTMTEGWQGPPALWGAVVMSGPAPGDRGLSGVPADELAAWVAQTCAAQGVPIKVTDLLLICPRHHTLAHLPGRTMQPAKGGKYRIHRQT
jgi:hypothetical protein